MPQGPWDSYKLLLEIRRRMNQLLGEGIDSFDSIGQLADEAASWKPPFDLVENESEFVIFGELPGMTKDDIKIQLQGYELVVKGERRPSPPEGTTGFHLAERYYGTFQRKFTLPEVIDEDAINSTFKDGLLEITVPKAEARTIPIK